MKAEELFPGAWVFENVPIEGGERDWKPRQVTGIDSLYVTLGGLAYTEWNHTLDDIVDYVKPIPLTPEILRDWFGFGLINQSEVFEGWFKGKNPVTKDYLIYLKRIRDGSPFFYRNGRHELKYVHQLQRLFHALTGEPLKRVDQ